MAGGKSTHQSNQALGAGQKRDSLTEGITTVPVINKKGTQNTDWKKQPTLTKHPKSSRRKQTNKQTKSQGKISDFGRWQSDFLVEPAGVEACGWPSLYGTRHPCVLDLWGFWKDDFNYSRNNSSHGESSPRWICFTKLPLWPRWVQVPHVERPANKSTSTIWGRRSLSV